MHGFEHFGADERAAGDDSFQGDHLPEMCRLQCPWAHMVVAKRSTEANFEVFRLDDGFFWIIGAQYHVE